MRSFAPSSATRCALILSALAAAALAVAAGPARAAWTPLATPFEEWPNSTNIGLDPQGNVFLRDLTGGYNVHWRGEDGSFLPAQNLSLGAITFSGFSSAGVGTWMGTQSSKMTAVRTSSGPARTELSRTQLDSDTTVFPIALAVNKPGDELFVWADKGVDGTTTPATLKVAFRTAAGALTTETIPQDTPNLSFADIFPSGGAVLDDDGKAAVVFKSAAGTAMVSYRATNGVWSAPTSISPTSPVYNVGVFSNADGDAVATWKAGATTSWYATARETGGSFPTASVPVKSEGSGYEVDLMSVAVAADGTGLLAFEEHHFPPYAYEVAVYKFTSGSSLVPFTSIADDAQSPAIAASRTNDHVVFAYNSVDTGGDDTKDVSVATGTLAGGLGPLTMLPKPSEADEADDPVVAVHSNGTAYVAYQSTLLPNGGTGYAHLACATSDGISDCAGEGGGDPGTPGGGGGTPADPGTGPDLPFDDRILVKNNPKTGIANEGKVGALPIKFVTTCKDANKTQCQVHIDGAATGSYNAASGSSASVAAKKKLLSFKLKSADKAIPAGQSATLTLTLSKKQVLQVRKALLARGKVVLTVRITVDGVAGKPKKIGFKLVKPKKKKAK